MTHEKLICQKCDLCHNELTGSVVPLVPGIGPEDADIMIVGMNPGKQEQQRLVPFIGRAGAVLDKALQAAGLRRDECYITNVVKHALPSTRKKLRKGEIDACRPFLDIELGYVKPKVVIALGGDAIGVFTGNGKVTEQRGRPMPLGKEYGNAILMPTFHPASFLYSGAEPTDLVTDLKLAKELAEGTKRLDYTDVTVVQTLDHFQGLLDNISSGGVVAFDLETTGLCPYKDCERITDIVFSAAPGTAYVVPLLQLENDVWVEFVPSEVAERAYDILRDPDIRKITHGGCFDYAMLLGHGILQYEDMDSWIYDTQYGHHALLDEHPPFDLEYMAASATDMAAWDQTKRQIEQVYGKGAVWMMSLKDRGLYGGGDGDATIRLAQSQERKVVERWGNFDFYNEVVGPALPVLAEIISNGFAVDLEQLRHIHRVYKKQLRVVEKKLLDVLGFDPNDEEVLEKLEIPKSSRYGDAWGFNVNSDDQMVRAIETFTSIKWPRDRDWYLTDKGDRPSSRKEVRNAMAEEQPHKIWNLWRDQKRLSKLLSQYITDETTLYASHSTSSTPRSITAKLCPNSHRVFTSLKPHGTRTGRRASRDPNLQNPPKRDDEGSEVQASLVRTVFVPSRPDWKIVACDFDSAEVWVAAHLSQDPELLRIIDENLDMHAMTAARVFGYEYEEFVELIEQGKKLSKQGSKLSGVLEKADAQRTKAKVVNFGGILYGGGARKIARDIDTDEREAQQILDEVAKVYSRFYEWREEQVELIRQRGYVETAYGRRRNLVWPDDKYKQGHIEREAFNSPIQGTVADHMLRVMPRVRAALQTIGEGAIVLEMHDELISETSASSAELWLERKVEAMTLNIPAFGKPLPVSGEIRDRWKPID